MKRAMKWALGLALVLGLGREAWAQSQPNWGQGYVPSPAEWNAWWAEKVNFTVGPHGPQVFVGAKGAINAQEGLFDIESWPNIVTISPNAGNGILSASITSMGGSPGALGAWAIGAFAINDNTTAVQTAYGQYIESRKMSGAGTTHGLEISVVNKGSLVSSDPYFMGPQGSTLGLWISGGRSGITGQNNPLSMAMGVIAAPTAWERGIVFGTGSVVDTGYGPGALVLPAAFGVQWFAPDRTLAALIRSDISSTSGFGHPAQIVFTGSGGVLVSANGSAGGIELQWFNDSVNVKNLNATGILNLPNSLIVGVTSGPADDAGAASAGVAVHGVYVTPDGVLHWRRS